MRGVGVIVFSRLVRRVKLFVANGEMKKHTEKESDGEDKRHRGNRIMNSRLLALSCLHAGFSVQCLSAGCVTEART